MAPSIPRRALRSQPRPTRGKPAFSYAEPSEDENDIEYEEEEKGDYTPAPSRPTSLRRSTNAKTRTTPRKRPYSTSFGSSHQSSKHSSKRSKQSKQLNPPGPVAASSQDITEITGGFIPPWQTLPYDILLQIFRYASFPLYDPQHFQPLPSGPWLLKIARLCKSFAEPAFTVLYTSPPLVPMDKAHMLVDLLKMDPTHLSFKYRQKVESLRIDVGQVAAYSLPGSGHLNIFSFVKDLPRLKALEFYHQKDMSPYRNLEDSIKWTYPGSLFDALEYNDPAADPSRGDKTSVCRLESWRWSSRLAGKKYPLESIREIHLKPSFLTLRRIAFVNYQLPPVRKGEEEPPKHEEILAGAISVLVKLKHLIFESSTLFNAKLLPLLPKTLEHLEVINCWDFHGDDFADFLTTHGSQLRSLTLNHNLSLNLSFLPILGTACPKLEILSMNLSYFNMHTFYNDSEPNYPQLLLTREVPYWPSSLQILELTQLRKWDTPAAEMFFQSLLDSAASLPDLRKLTIQAILNIGWRDRATFRDKWIGSINRIFKRVSAPPTFTPRIVIPLTDGPASPKIKAQASPEMLIAKRQSLRSSTSSTALPPPASTATSKSIRIVIRTRPTEEEEDSSTRRSTRKSTRQAQTGKYAESSDNSDNEDSYAPDPEPGESARHLARQSCFSRELITLHQTAGSDGQELSSTTPSATDSSSEDDGKNSSNRKGRAEEVVQGMCEVVDLRIDNLRPRETMVTEADFLDEEAPGDGDWNGDDDADEGYAW